jgi:hypothetical protein
MASKVTVQAVVDVGKDKERKVNWGRRRSVQLVLSEFAVRLGKPLINGSFRRKKLSRRALNLPGFPFNAQIAQIRLR